MVWLGGIGVEVLLGCYKCDISVRRRAVGLPGRRGVSRGSVVRNHLREERLSGSC